MEGLGPFEPAPVLAVAVSGGADSMALALLADRWARARRGRIVALTVDHGLRAESGAEAHTVGRWLKAKRIAHATLAWRRTSDDVTTANLQAWARAARYRLMSDWCVEHGVLHLLLAHHRDDQAETLLLRLGRGSGVDGLAAMAPVREMYGIRLLRPLLGFSHAQLEATLRRPGQPWIEDPSNTNVRFARVRLRALAAALADEGLTSERLAATAARLRSAREALEHGTAAFLATAATPFAEGYVTLSRAALRDAPNEIAARAVARLVSAVGGLAYAPRRIRCERLLAALLASPRGPRVGASDAVLATLGGVLVVANATDALLFVREPSAVAKPIAVSGPGSYTWDGRFRIAVRTVAASGSGFPAIGALGAAGARRVIAEANTSAARHLAALPRRVRATVPALLDRANRPLALANFDFSAAYGRTGAGADSLASGHWSLDARFAPPLPLVGPGNPVSSLFKARGDTI